ncbi:ATP-binding protein [Croceiramulus getboli]|nr:PAS domain-containing sensor histidine kinase [Flavobacteriaceae bacterium YJPT1-3]
MAANQPQHGQYNKAAQDLELVKSAFESNQDLSYKLFDHMPIAICITNEQGQFTDVNERYCKNYGYTREELLGQPFTMVVPQEHRANLEHLHDEFFAKKYELKGRWNVKDRHGDTFEIVTNAAYIKNKKDEPRKMTFVIRSSEVSDALQSLQDTIDLLEEKIRVQESASDLAEHGMRNNLGAIVSIADILMHSDLNEQQLKWVKMIKDIGYDTLNLLKASKDYVLMEKGDYELDIKPFNLMALLQNEFFDWANLAIQKDIEIKTYLNDKSIEVESTQLEIKADEFYIKRLIHNLLGNALEASPEGEPIALKINTDTGLRIELHNYGAIPESIRQTFFEKYTTSGKEKGTGLGTYISKLITETHGGDISFLTSEESGTTLTVFLPNIEVVHSS